MKSPFLYTILLAAAALWSACMNSGNKSAADETQLKIAADGKGDDDTKFIMEAANGGMYEVMLGKFAMEHASDPEVKVLGERMFKDHSKANEELKALAQRKGLTLPTAISDKLIKQYDGIVEKTGPDFDKAYSEEMVEDHKNDIPLFEKEAKNGTDTDVRLWAAGKVQVLKDHLRMSQDVYDGLKGKKDEPDLEHHQDNKDDKNK